MDPFSTSFVDNNVLPPWGSLYHEGSCTTDIGDYSDGNGLPHSLASLMTGSALCTDEFDKHTQAITSPILELNADDMGDRGTYDPSSAIHLLKTSSTTLCPRYLSKSSWTVTNSAKEAEMFSTRELLNTYQHTQASLLAAPYSAVFHGAPHCSPPFQNAISGKSPCTSSCGVNQAHAGHTTQKATASPCNIQMRGSDSTTWHKSNTSNHPPSSKKRRSGHKMDTKTITGSVNSVTKEVHHSYANMEPSTNNSNTNDSNLSKPLTVSKGLTDGPKLDYIHVRARRGEATDIHSLAERVRREKISEKMRYLQKLVPGCSKITGKAVMLDEIINYIQSLQRQIEFLSMKLASVNPSTMDALFGSKVPQFIRFPFQSLLFHNGDDLRCCQHGKSSLQARSTVSPSQIAHNQSYNQEPASWRPISTPVPSTNVFVGKDADSQQISGFVE